MKRFEVEYDKAREVFVIVSDGWTSTRSDNDSVVRELDEWLEGVCVDE